MSLLTAKIIKGGTINGVRKDLVISPVLDADGETYKWEESQFKALQAEMDQLNVKALQAESLQAQVDELAQPLRDETLALQKALALPETTEEVLKAMTLKALNDGLEKLKTMDAKINPKGQVKDEDGKDEEDVSKGLLNEMTYD